MLNWRRCIVVEKLVSAGELSQSCSNLANSAFHPSGVGKRVATHAIRCFGCGRKWQNTRWEVWPTTYVIWVLQPVSWSMLTAGSVAKEREIVPILEALGCEHVIISSGGSCGFAFDKPRKKDRFSWKILSKCCKLSLHKFSQLYDFEFVQCAVMDLGRKVSIVFASVLLINPASLCCKVSIFALYFVCVYFNWWSPHLHLTSSKVMVIVWRLRGNIIRTVLYIANVLPLQWAQLTKTVHTARLGLEFVFLCFIRLHDLSLCLCMFCFALNSWVISIHVLALA